MESPPLLLYSMDLQAVQVRATWGAQEHRLRDRLVAAHHYLECGTLFGKGLRQVATLDSAWVALVGWQAAALQVTVRDRWLGWTIEQQLRRLHLVAQNSRFLILPAFQCIPALASRVPGLSLPRLARDRQRERGSRGVGREFMRRPRVGVSGVAQGAHTARGGPPAGASRAGRPACA